MTEIKERPLVTRRTRLGVIVGASILGLVLLSVAANFLLRPSPSDVVGTYITAMERGDYNKAYAELSSTSQKSVRNPAGLEQTAIGAAYKNNLAYSHKVGRTTDAGKDRKTVEVTLLGGSNEMALKVFVIKEGGRWRAEA